MLPTMLLAVGCYKPPEHSGGASGTRYGCSMRAPSPPSAVQLDSRVFEQLVQNYIEVFLQGLGR